MGYVIATDELFDVQILQNVGLAGWAVRAIYRLGWLLSQA